MSEQDIDEAGKSEEELSACCQTPIIQSRSDEGTCSDICSRCKKNFVPQWICRPCGILRGTGNPKGASEKVAKRGLCGWCGRVGEVVPPIFYNIKP